MSVYFRSSLWRVRAKQLLTDNLSAVRTCVKYCSGSADNKTKVDVKQLLDDAATFEDQVPKKAEDVWSTSPYPSNLQGKSQARHSLRPMIDPRETTIIFFPGQGNQYVGMGKELLKFPTVRDIFKAANDVLQYDILKLCLEGPKEKLQNTKYQQVAIFVCSIAALERLKEEQPSVIENCIATAGFSLGELAALVFAEVLSFEKALKLVKVRAEAMQYAAEMNPGAMVTTYFGPDSKVGYACLRATEYAASQGVENAYCGISNYLFPHCKIIGGSVQAIEFLEQNKDEFKLRKLVRLPVNGAFHTPLMKPAIEPFKLALNKIKLSDPVIAVHSNIDGKVYKSADHIRKRLPKQIIAPVKWEQTLHILYERPDTVPFPRSFECGPGKSLSTVLKQVNLKASQTCYNIPA